MVSSNVLSPCLAAIPGHSASMKQMSANVIYGLFFHLTTLRDYLVILHRWLHDVIDQGINKSITATHCAKETQAAPSSHGNLVRTGCQRYGRLIQQQQLRSAPSCQIQSWPQQNVKICLLRSLKAALGTIWVIGWARMRPMTPRHKSFIRGTTEDNKPSFWIFIWSMVAKIVLRSSYLKVTLEGAGIKWS